MSIGDDWLVSVKSAVAEAAMLPWAAVCLDREPERSIPSPSVFPTRSAPNVVFPLHPDTDEAYPT